MVSTHAKVRSAMVCWLALAACATAQTESNAPRATDAPRALGKFFQVTCEGGTEEMARQALAVVEPVWPIVRKAFGLASARPQKPLPIYLYRTVDGYLAADQRLSGGKFQPNQAMSHWNTKSAHVAMQPPCSDECLESFGLPMQTQAMLAWEACHVARFELCANFRSHPGWFHDGLAATVAREALAEVHGELGEQPFFQQRWWRVRALAESGDLPNAAALLADQTQSLDMRDRYAARIAFFNFARSTARQKIVTLAKKIRQTGGGKAYRGKIAKAARMSLGPLDAKFRKQVAATKPVWNEVYRSLWCLGDEWRQVAFAGTNAIAFRTEPVRGGSFEATGKVYIVAGEAQQMNFVFGRTDQGFYSLAFVAGTGFTLFDHRFDGNQWLRLLRGNAPNCKPGIDVPFAVRGVGKKLEVELAGRTWKVDLPRKLPEEIVWGIGAQCHVRERGYGSAGVWRGVTVGTSR